MSKLGSIITAVMLFGCFFVQATETVYGTEPTLLSAPYYKSVLSETAWGINYLHQLNIDDVEGLRKILHFSLAMDAVLLYSTTQHKEIEQKEKERIFSQLLLMSVQNEKYPVKEWLDNDELMTIFGEVQKRNPILLEEMRGRNWNKPMWVN